VGSATSSSSSPELAAALHRLRSTLARLKAELELSQSDGSALPVDRLLADLSDAFSHLRGVEVAAFGLVSILVVDDDERLAELTARGLRRLGYEAESTGALRQLRPNELVVFDLSLASGLDEGTRRALTTARPIVVTGATDPGSRAQAARLGASDYLVKPVELDDLVAAINRRRAEGSQ
jgi:CheY-like chemotaxis protein